MFCGLLLGVCGLVCSRSADFFFQAEDGIRDLVRSRGLGDVYKRQAYLFWIENTPKEFRAGIRRRLMARSLLEAQSLHLSLIHI